MNILLVGANGKMGQKVLNVNDKDICVYAKIDNSFKNSNAKKEYTSFKKIPFDIINKIDIVLDFCLPDILNDQLNFCLKYNKPLVICSTGHNQKQLQDIKNASKKIPIFKTTNTSVGVAVINQILNNFCNLNNKYKAVVIEKHHKNKKDSPSGTAKIFLDILNKNNYLCDCCSIRAGTCVGEHEIVFMGEKEQISIKHTAEDRSLFAIGAINICKYMQNKPCGKLYDMNDLLN